MSNITDVRRDADVPEPKNTWRSYLLVGAIVAAVVVLAATVSEALNDEKVPQVSSSVTAPAPYLTGDWPTEVPAAGYPAAPASVKR